MWGWQVLEEMSLDEKTAVSSYIEKLGIVIGLLEVSHLSTLDFFGLVAMLQIGTQNGSFYINFP